MLYIADKSGSNSLMTGRIVYHCTRRHAYAVTGWLGAFAAADDVPEIVLQPYEAIADNQPLSRGTHVFTDQDRLDAASMASAVALARRVAAAGRGFAVAN